MFCSLGSIFNHHCIDSFSGFCMRPIEFGWWEATVTIFCYTKRKRWSKLFLMGFWSRRFGPPQGCVWPHGSQRSGYRCALRWAHAGKSIFTHFFFVAAFRSLDLLLSKYFCVRWHLLMSQGRCHKERSGFEGAWTSNPLIFDNSYFK